MLRSEKTIKETTPKMYTVNLITDTEMLASSPAQRDVYEQFIGDKKRDQRSKKGQDVVTLTKEELETLPEVTPEMQEQKGWSTYHRDDKGIFIFEYKIKGFLKAAASALTGTKGMKAYKSKIDRFVFVTPRRIHLFKPDGLPVTPDDITLHERPIRAMTPMGPRTSLKRSDQVESGIKFSFKISVLPLGQEEISEEQIQSWFTYGQFSGLGERRNDGWGRFSFELGSISADVDQETAVAAV